MGTRRALAALEIALVFPATLFMAALLLRNLQPHQFEPAHTAERVVEWYGANPTIGLSMLVVALPLIVLAVGSATLLRAWQTDAQLRAATRETVALFRKHAATICIAVVTLGAAGILGIVALHVITD